MLLITKNWQVALRSKRSKRSELASRMLALPDLAVMTRTCGWSILGLAQRPDMAFLGVLVGHIAGVL